MRAFEDFPVIKPLPPFARDEVQPAMTIHMPLADVTGVIARRAQDFRYRDRLRVKRHVIQKDAVCQGSLPGQQRRSHRGANRHGRDGVDKLNALTLEPVEVGSLDIRITRVSERLRPPLVGKNKDNVRGARAAVALGRLRLGCARCHNQRHKSQRQAAHDHARPDVTCNGHRQGLSEGRITRPAVAPRRARQTNSAGRPGRRHLSHDA